MGACDEALDGALVGAGTGVFDEAVGGLAVGAAVDALADDGIYGGSC